MQRPCRTILLVLLPLAAVLAGSSAMAGDADGCLNCHQYRGLARIAEDGKSILHFYVDPEYYRLGLGPHARLRCTDCHKREEVEVFPHRKISAVDCSSACHLDASTQVEIRFSHERVHDMLRGSVHSEDVLSRSNQLLGQPLRAEQSKCLLCHDEPAFTRSRMSWVQQEAPTSRCNVCHDEQLPQNTLFSYWHVHARTQPQRSSQEIIKLCGLCHSNPAIRAEFGLPDAMASYLASFHGKAVLLGSDQTAGCLDCHVSPLQNVHVMQAKSDPTSPTHPDQLDDTCRTPECHPLAGERISSAAIHLNLPTSRGVEFLIACIFVLLIILTFGPSLLLTALKMLQIVVGRKDEEHGHHVRAARRLLADPEGQRRLVRFTIHQRFQHWFLMVTFTTLVLTGFPIKYADHGWAEWLIGVLGGLPMARALHRWAGALLIGGFFYHVGYIGWCIVQSRRATGKSLFRIIWELPMMIRPADGKHMLGLLLHVLFLRRKAPAGDRFNPEEKFEYIGVFWGIFVLGTTGLLMWANAWASRYVAGRLLTIASLVHTFEAFLALLHVGIVHMASVIFAPGVFPISPAMFNGQTPPEELVEGHGAMLAEVEHELNGTPAGEVQHA